MTGRYGFGYVSDVYPSPLQYISDSLLIYKRNRESPLKHAPNTALRLTHVRERQLAVPPLLIIPI